MNAVLIPVRSTAGGKSRLAQVLSSSQREAMAMAMLSDLVEACARAVTVDATFVVSSDASVLEAARDLGVAGIAEGAPRGLNSAVQLAAREIERCGARRLLTIPGDVPCAQAGEIDRLFRMDGAEHPVIAVPSGLGTGTNALLTSPPTAVDFRFEGESLKAFGRAAAERGLGFFVASFGGFALDVDTPEDLAALATLANGAIGSAPDSEAGAVLSGQRSYRLAREFLGEGATPATGPDGLAGASGPRTVCLEVDAVDRPASA